MKSLVALACCAVGLYLLSIGMDEWGLARVASAFRGSACAFPGLILFAGGVFEGLSGAGAKAQGAAHGEAKRAGESVGP